MVQANSQSGLRVGVSGESLPRKSRLQQRIYLPRFRSNRGRKATEKGFREFSLNDDYGLYFWAKVSLWGLA